VNPEPPLTGSQIVTVLGFLADLAQQAGQHRLVQFRVVGRFLIDRELHIATDQAQLAVGITPLAQPEVVEEVLAAPVAQGAGRQRLALLFKTAPDVDQTGEV